MTWAIQVRQGILQSRNITVNRRETPLHTNEEPPGRTNQISWLYKSNSHTNNPNPHNGIGIKIHTDSKATKLKTEEKTHLKIICVLKEGVW